MGKLRVWLVLLLGMLIASVSGVAVAASKPDGRGKPGGGGGYSKPVAPRGSGGYNRPAPPSGGYTRPDRYHKPSGDYYRPPSGYYKPGWHHDHDDDDWNVGFYINPFFYWPWYYPSSYYYSPYYYPPYYPPVIVQQQPQEVEDGRKMRLHRLGRGRGRPGFFLLQLGLGFVKHRRVL